MEERLEKICGDTWLRKGKGKCCFAEANGIEKWVLYLGQSKKISGLKILFRLSISSNSRA